MTTRQSPGRFLPTLHPTPEPPTALKAARVHGVPSGFCSPPPRRQRKCRRGKPTASAMCSWSGRRAKAFVETASAPGTPLPLTGQQLWARGCMGLGWGLGGEQRGRGQASGLGSGTPQESPPFSRCSALRSWQVTGVCWPLGGLRGGSTSPAQSPCGRSNDEPQREFQGVT